MENMFCLAGHEKIPFRMEGDPVLILFSKCSAERLQRFVYEVENVRIQAGNEAGYRSEIH